MSSTLRRDRLLWCMDPSWRLDRIYWTSIIFAEPYSSMDGMCTLKKTFDGYSDSGFKHQAPPRSGVGKASDHLRSWVRRPWKLPFRKWIKNINFSLHQWTWLYWEGRRALLSALWEKRRALRLASLKILLEHSRRKSTQNRETEKHRKNIVKSLKAAFSGRTRVSNGSF